jgi:hypothetical protein
MFLWHCAEAASGDRKVVCSFSLEQGGLGHLKVNNICNRKFFIYLTSSNIWKFCPHLPVFVSLLHKQLSLDLLSWTDGLHDFRSEN